MLGICMAHARRPRVLGVEAAGVLPQKTLVPITGLNAPFNTDPSHMPAPSLACAPHSGWVPLWCPRAPALTTPVPQAWVSVPIPLPSLGPSRALKSSPPACFIQHMSFLYSYLNASGLGLDQVLGNT